MEYLKETRHVIACSNSRDTGSVLGWINVYIVKTGDDI